MTSTTSLVRRRSSWRAPRTTLLAASLALTAACSDEDAEPPRPYLGKGDYAIAVTVFNDDGETGYVSLIDDPARETEFATDRALEIGGAVSLFTVQGDRVFGLGSSDAPSVIRYAIDDDGYAEVTGRMSLANEGVSSAFKRAELVPFISDSKAYWLDQEVIVWDPSAMIVSGTFSLAEAEREDYSIELGEALVRDGHVYVAASYRSEADESELGVALVLVIDAERDELIEVLRDDRCGETTHLALDREGDLYVSSGVIAATFHANGQADYPAPCMLRIRAGEQAFDPDFMITLSELTDGRDAGHLVQGLDGNAYILALHPDLLDEELDAEADIWARYDAAAWRWWSIQLGSREPGSLIDDVAAGSAAAQVLSADGIGYIALANIEAGYSTLLAPTEDGGLRPGLRAGGLPYGLIKLE